MLRKFQDTHSGKEMLSYTLQDKVKYQFFLFVIVCTINPFIPIALCLFKLVLPFPPSRQPLFHQSTNKSLYNCAPGTTEYLLRSLIPSATKTSSSIKQFPVHIEDAFLKIK